MQAFRKHLIVTLALLNAILPLTPILTVTLQSFNVAAAGTADNAVQDSKLPFSTVSINDGTSYTRDSLVDVKVKLSPSASKTKLLSARFLLCNWHDECQSMHPDHPYWSDWRNVDTFGKVNSSGEIEFSVKQVLSNPQVEGKKNVCVQVQDTKGNVSPYACDYIYLDTSSPTGSLSINSGAGSTNTNELTLNLSATDPKLQAGTKYEINGAGNLKYSLSTDGSNWTAWSKLADLHSATKDIAYSFPGNLTNPTEIVMYVKYADRLGNESLTYSDSIWYGTPTTPVSPPTQTGSGSVVINNGAVFTASQVVTLNLKTTGSKPTSMKVWNRGENSDAVAKVPYSENVAWTLSAGYETKHVYAQFFYSNGTSSEAVVDEITYAPVYGISYHDAITGNAEHTLSSMPSSLITGQNFDLTLKVHNFGSMTWPQNGSNPVQIAYHWVRADGTSYLFEGTRTNLNQNLPYQQHDDNIRLKVTAPTEPGNYILQIDAVHHGHTWFSWSGNAPLEYQVEVFNSQVPGFSSTQNVLGDVSTLSYVSHYIVKRPRLFDPTWRCGGHDCLTAIAEEVYQCTARGIPNFDSTSSASLEFKDQCWWPIFAANQELFKNVPDQYLARPWSYLLPNWVLTIPGMVGSPTAPYLPGVLPPIPSSFVSLVNHATELDPYGGINGAYTAWPDLTFDRFIAWDGSVKWNQVKWSETRRPSAPTITSIQVDQTGTAATVYGVAIPKNHPMHIRVWNEFRDCWGCGSGWELHHQVGTAEHVKVVLFKNNWQYIGEVWNDRSDGRWSITLPLDTVINPGDTIYAETQVEAGFTFHNLHWWDDTTENVYFDLRDPYYFGVPYFASSTSNRAGVPRKPLTNMAEWAILYRENAYWKHPVAVEIHQYCNAWVKDYFELSSINETNPTYTNLIYNPRTNWAHTLNGEIRLSYWNDYQGTCGGLGLPSTDKQVAGVNGYTQTTGTYQQFDNGTIYSSKLGVYGVVGKLNAKHSAYGGTGTIGFPTRQASRSNDGIWCQVFERGEVCEDDLDCPVGTGWDRDSKQCLDLNTLSCKFIQKGLPGPVPIVHACVIANAEYYAKDQNPTLDIHIGNASSFTLEISGAADQNTVFTNHFEYKSWRYAADGSGQVKGLTIPRNLLWFNSKDGEVKKVYYRITTYDNAGKPLKVYPERNDNYHSFDVQIRTPEYINPLESDPYYTGPTTYDGHGLAQDFGTRKNANLRIARSGEIERIETWIYSNCWQVPSRNNTLNSVIGVKDSDGVVTRYRHMSEESMNRLLLGDVVNGIPPYSRGMQISQNMDAGDVSDLGCSDPGFDHLHIEMFGPNGELSPLTKILF